MYTIIHKLAIALSSWILLVVHFDVPSTVVQVFDI